jgi:hypothetical protein
VRSVASTLHFAKLGSEMNQITTTLPAAMKRKSSVGSLPG